MTQSTLLQQIAETNKSFLAGTPRQLDPAGEPFVVVACIDPRLTGFLEPALGLPRHRAVLIRTAGSQIASPDAMRSIAVALFVKNAREIVVVGHTDCGLANFSAADVAENFRKGGILRTAFGDQDLRSWFGAFANIRDNVLGSIDYIRKSGLVPGDIKIHGLIFDTNQGSFEVVMDGSVIREVAALAPVVPPSKSPGTDIVEPLPKEPPPAAHTESPPVPRPAPPPELPPKKGPVIVGPPAAKVDHPVIMPNSLLEAALVFRDFFHRERQNQQMQRAIADLRTMWRQEKNPVRVFAELHRLGHAYQDRYPKLAGSLLYMENAIKSGSAEKFGFGELLRRILD
jgi:carbonic anhydrase